jgi:alkylhydroperoxidase family enzyme
MVALGRPGVGEELLTGAGFVDVERVTIPFAWEFADPAAYARALVSTGPAYEAIQAVGEAVVYDFAVQHARERVRDGLPLRAEIEVAGFLARKPASQRADGAGLWPDAGFLTVPEPTPDVQRLYDEDVEDLGYVMNVSRLWAQLPSAQDALFELLGQATKAGRLTLRQRGILVTACAATLGDSYCSLAWGKKLAGEADPELAGAVLSGTDGPLDAQERALAAWARRVTRDPNQTTVEDVAALRDAGFDDRQVFAITLFVALRLAFATVNDALGVLPDRELGDTAPAPVREAVTYGRPVGSGAGQGESDPGRP